MRLVVAFTLVAVSFAPLVDAATYTVNACGTSWCPSSLTIDVGDTVTFAFGSGAHTWVRDDQPDSCGSTCSRTFTSPATVTYHCGFHAGMTGVIQVGPGATIAIATPSEGGTVSGDVVVEGTASTPAGTVSSVLVRFDNFGSVEATLSESGASVTWSASLPSASLVEGIHRITARATATSGLFAETFVDVTVDNPDVIDVRALFISAQASAITTNGITYTLRNEGNVATGLFSARVEYFYQGEWRLIGQRNFNIPPQVNAPGSVVWDPPGVLVGSFPIRVVADPALALPDADRADNVATGTAGWFTTAVPGIDLTDPV